MEWGTGVVTKLLKLFLGVMGRLLLALLSLDLLYLYYVGAWTDPVTIILTVELMLLWLFLVAGLAWSIHYFRCFAKGVKCP